MEKLDVIVRSTLVLFIVIFLELAFGPIIEDVFKLGLISLKDLPDPTVPSFWRLLMFLLEIGGVYSIVFYVEDYIKNIV